MKQSIKENKPIYNEEKGEWNINIGDIILYENRLWMIKDINTTLIHNHEYMKVITYRLFWGAITRKIYSYQAKSIKQYYKTEKQR